MKYTGNATRQKYNTGSADSNCVCGKIRYFALTDDECFITVLNVCYFSVSKRYYRFLKIFPPTFFYIYASAGTSYGPVSVCLCLSVTSGSSIETDELIELVLACELPSTYPTLF